MEWIPLKGRRPGQAVEWDLEHSNSEKAFGLSQKRSPGV